MNGERARLFREATLTALRIRQGAGLGLTSAINIYDFVESQGVAVRFVNIPSMEGMYSVDPGPLVLIAADRPSGRQAFSCAHEFGHHVFGHGVKIDKLAVGATKSHLFNAEEFLVDCFAGALLMPRPLIQTAFRRRGWDPATATSLQFYSVSSWLGVSFEGLLNHASSLGVLTRAHADKLLSESPSAIRKDLLGRANSGELFVVDQHWIDRPIDIRVGDLLVLCDGISGDASIVISENLTTRLGSVFKGNCPGISRLSNEDGKWSAYVRVSKKGFVGLAQYRHLEHAQGDE